MEYIYIGKIVNTHGIKGEIRIISDFKYKEKIFINGMNIYIGKEKIKETINTYRRHKNFDMITMYGYDNINDILKYKGNKVFILREDLELKEDEYLDSDIIDFDVLINNKVIGKVKNIERYSNNNLIVVNNGVKDFLIPFVSDIIELDLQKKEIIVDDIKGLI